MNLEIIYQDTYIVVINKPHGLLVHPSPIARDADTSAMELLRDQIGQKVYPVHRIDRKTSGVLLFALDKSTNQSLTEQFTDKSVQKKYVAIVRGYAPEEMNINYPLYNENGVLQEAHTKIIRRATSEIDRASENHSTSRYSLIEAFPTTGRMHQIRKHLAHIFHPIIGDRPHGCNKQNRLWLQYFQMNTMLLHAASIEFMHPYAREKMVLQSRLSEEFKRVMKILSFDFQNV